MNFGQIVDILESNIKSRVESELEYHLNELKELQYSFQKDFEVFDIYSNSKIFEILIADNLNHKLIPGHSGSSDALNVQNNEVEYKHYKETSSNHTWTFNDFSEKTIFKLNDKIDTVYFSHIDDTVFPPKFDWYYPVIGKVISDFLREHTPKIQNKRKMINVSRKNIEERMHVQRHLTQSTQGIYTRELDRIIKTISKIENKSDVKNLLTSNK